jgi:hypothetical protein
VTSRASRSASATLGSSPTPVWTGDGWRISCCIGSDTTHGVQEIEVLGVFIQSFAHACVNLQILAAVDASELAGADPGAWYPAQRFVATIAAIEQRFPVFDPIKERIGVEMMRLWYEHGPGRAIVKRGVDFLHHQTGSMGYHGVVRGPDIGAFALDMLDEAAGRARVRSTTPFDRTMERGVLLGGLKLAGDHAYVDVDNRADPSVFEIEFH